MDVAVWGNVPCVSKIDTLDFSTVYSNRISELSKDYLVNRPTRSFVRASRGRHSFLLGCRDVPQYKVMKYLVFGVISSSLLPHMTTRIRMRMQSIPDRAFQGGPSCSLRPRRRETSADAPSDSQYFKDLRRGVLRAFWDLNAENGVFFRTEVFLDSIFSFSLDF